MLEFLAEQQIEWLTTLRQSIAQTWLIWNVVMFQPSLQPLCWPGTETNILKVTVEQSELY